MSTGAPNLACEVSLAPIACPRNPGLPEGSLRLVKRRADLAARDPNAGFASAMSELEECASMEEHDEAYVKETPSSRDAGVAHVASPANTASPATAASAARAEAPPVALGARPSQTDPEAARFVAAVMAYAAVTAEETPGSRRVEREAGNVFQEMRAGVEEHIMSVVGSQKETDGGENAEPEPLAETEPVESAVEVGADAAETRLVAEDSAAATMSAEAADAPTRQVGASAEPDAPAPDYQNRRAPTRLTGLGASGATAAAALIAAVAVAAAAAFARRLRRERRPEASEAARATNAEASEGRLPGRFAKARGAARRVACGSVVRAWALSQTFARGAMARRAVAVAGRVAVAARRATAGTAARLPFRRAAASASSSATAARVPEAHTDETALVADAVLDVGTSAVSPDEPEPASLSSPDAARAEPDPDSDSDDPDEAIFEEASKIGRDLIRGLLPTPLMLHGKTRPRWAEGDMSPAAGVNAGEPAPETRDARSPGTPPSELERADSREAPAAFFVDSARMLASTADDSSDELSSAGDASESESESESEYDSGNSESYVSGIGPGVRAPALAPNAFGAGSPGFFANPNGSPEATAAALAQYQQFLQYQQFTQFQQMQQMQQMQMRGAYATPGAAAPGPGGGFGAASPASPGLREMAKMAIAHRRRALARLAFARLRQHARAARRARSAERRERRRSAAARRRSSSPLESSGSGSRTKKPFVRTRVIEIERSAAAAALERERETATAMAAMSVHAPVGIAA